MITLKEIAKEAQVSVSTVSYVLSGKEKASPKTANKIREIAKRLGYVPNQTASSLRTKKSKTVGVLIPQFTTLFFVNVVKAIEDVLYQNGYNMLLATSHADLRREQVGVQNLLGNRIAGLMITSNDRHNDPIPKNVGLPVLKMYESLHPEDCCISVNNEIGGRLVGEYLANRGLVPAACVGYTTCPDTVLERVEAFRTALAHSGHPVDDCMVMGLNEQTYEGGYRATMNLIAQGLPFRSIFACTDNIAMGVMRALSESGLSVPDDVAIVGYDNTLMAEMSLPSLTSVDMRAKELGRQGARMMVNLIEGKPIEERRICLSPNLVPRESA